MPTAISCSIYQNGRDTKMAISFTNEINYSGSEMHIKNTLSKNDLLCNIRWVGERFGANGNGRDIQRRGIKKQILIPVECWFNCDFFLFTFDSFCWLQ